jgi:hypothetical protein
MTGGLIQIATYGAHDLFLTGNPQVTYFKVVHRRHTNFSMETFRLPFDNAPGFGDIGKINIQDIGDLLYKMYVEVTIPKVELYRAATAAATIATALSNYNTANTNFQTVKTFMKANMDAYRSAYESYSASNTVFATDMIDAMDTSFANYNQIVYDNYNTLINADPLVLQPSPSFNTDLANLQTIRDYYNTDKATIPKQTLMDALDIAYDYSKQLLVLYNDKVNELLATYNDLNSQRLKFAWVDNIGHSIIEYAEFSIGGRCIDKQYGQWIALWYDLTGNKRNQTLYDRMIGNDTALTTFDRTTKSKYTLIIPLQFWFCRYNGLAIPLVAMEYHNASVDVKFRNLEDVSYVEDGKLIYLSQAATSDTDNGRYLDTLGSDDGFFIETNMLIEYIYLDTKERRRFAQSSHEYLIEQVQVNEFNGINTVKVNQALDFTHPSKLLIWFMQQDKYITNDDGYTKCQWENYTTNDDASGNPITTSHMMFNSHDRFQKRNGDYFNYHIPKQYLRNTPADGINVYSFSLKPGEYQPHGEANLSRITRTTLNLEVDSSMFTSGSCTLWSFSLNYNVLRVANGFAGLAYTY